MSDVERFEKEAIRARHTRDLKRRKMLQAIEEFDNSSCALVLAIDRLERAKDRDKERAEEYERNHPKCPECGGDLGGTQLGRIEEHAPGCPRFPL